MQKLSQTLFFKLSRSLLLLLLILVAIQLIFLGTYWRTFLDETEQRLNWRIADKIAPELQKLIERKATLLEMLEFARRVTDINPKLDLYVLEPNGTIRIDLSLGSSNDRQAIDLSQVLQTLNASSIPPFPFYVPDPSSPDHGVVFSISPIKADGQTYYLLVTLNSWRNKAFYAYVGENQVGRALAFLSSVSFLITAAIGILAFFVLTKRFRTVTAQVEKFKNKDFSQRLTVSSDDELGQLAGTMNEMADTIVAGFKELEQRDQLRRDLIANVSHDLRGPVSIINGYAEDFLERAEQVTPPKVREFGEVLLRNVGSLQKLLHELFELAKLETKETAPEFEAFPIDQTISGLVGSYVGRAAELSLQLEDACDDRLPLVIGDIAMIDRVLTNLLENALRYTPAGGTVSLRAKRDDRGVCVEVSDTGYGIPEEDLPMIFDRFYRVATSKPRTGTSTGLGLAIVKKILEAHHTPIHVRSTVGKGTTFSFTLALAGSPQSG